MDTSATPNHTAPGHRTWHMTPRPVWEAQNENDSYLPEAYAADGFIHCTDTEDELIAVGNRYYQADPRAFVALEIDCDRVTAPVIYEDDNRMFPHIYGALPVAAVVSVVTLLRDASGQFVSFGDRHPTR